MTSIEHDPVEAARELAQLDGLSALRAIAAGELPPPPIGVLLGFEIVEVERAVWSLRSTPRRTTQGGSAPLRPPA